MQKKELSNTRFIIESGRYLLAESGTYITSVLYTKESKGKTLLLQMEVLITIKLVPLEVE